MEKHTVQMVELESPALVDVYDVHYRNENTKGEWHRWFSAPRRDIKDCTEWMEKYNRPLSIAGGLVGVPMQKGLRTEFRIVRMQRNVVSTYVKQD